MARFQNFSVTAAIPGFGEAGASFRALPAWAYRSKELLELEYEKVILPSWQFACHVNQLKQPGDYTTLDLMHDSVIIMRGRDGEIRAFKNVCRHRGAKLLDGSGHCKGAIVCPYHGWTYNQDGGLRALPAAKTFPGLDLKKFGLQTVEHEVFHGLVFVRIVPGGPTLKDMWGGLSELLEPYHIEKHELVGDGIGKMEWNCNWKVGVDNNLENYHVPVGHPGYHRMLDLAPDDLVTPHGVFGSIATLKDEPSSNRAERFYQRLASEVLTDLDPKTRRTWLFFTMPPNIGIDVYSDSIDLYQILPRTADSCTVRYPIYAPKDERREARVLRYLNFRINRQVGNEDRELCERVQFGLSSHAYEQGPLSSLEIALKDFHDRIEEQIPSIRDRVQPERLLAAE